MSMRKIAAVIGSSGIGKSKLAVELCKALHGQAINADALQVYKGLDIITNKMPVNEREGVKHHLMDFLNPEEEYKVTEFLKDASNKIESISEQNQLPVIVGGTNYYIQSLIWNNSLIGQKDKGPTLNDFPELDKLETSELYERLSQADPVMANKWHPSDRRKILRSLKVNSKENKKKEEKIYQATKIFHQTGQPQSEIIKLQKEQNESDGLKPRYRSLIFWIYAEPSKLNPRLDARVDQMIETGLFDEIKDLRNRVVQGLVKMPDYDVERYQRGLWQAIGYKEFDPYFNALEEGKEETELLKIKVECTERMKAATRRYAKRQIQWIRNKLLPTVLNSKGDDVLVYVLDANDLENWNLNVKDEAIKVAKAFQNNLPMPSPTSLSETAETMLTLSENAQDTQSRVLNWKKYVCDVCKTDKGEPLQLNGDMEWQQHKKSRYHRKYVKHLKVEAMRKAYMELKKPENA